MRLPDIENGFDILDVVHSSTFFTGLPEGHGALLKAGIIQHEGIHPLSN